MEKPQNVSVRLRLKKGGFPVFVDRAGKEDEPLIGLSLLGRRGKNDLMLLDGRRAARAVIGGAMSAGELVPVGGIGRAVVGDRLSGAERYLVFDARSNAAAGDRCGARGNAIE